MKRLLMLLVALTLALTPVFAKGKGGGGNRYKAPVNVPGYTKKDGTYVAPHKRSAPDKSYNNNWTVKPNTNPYTGTPGTKQPTPNDKPPKK